MHFEWNARFIWRFKMWCLSQKASRVWFRDVSSDKQPNKTTHIRCLSAMSFMASCTFYWRHFDRSSSIWIHFKWRRWLDTINKTINKTLIPVDFPSTFNFLKCARPQGFSCCINQYAWSQYCKCKTKPSLKKNSSCWCKVN